MDILSLNQYAVCVSTGTTDLIINQPIQIGQQPILNGKKIYRIEAVTSTQITKGKNGNAAITDALLKNFNLVISVVNPGNGQQQQPFDTIPCVSLSPTLNGLQAIRAFNDISLDYNNTNVIANSAVSLSGVSYDITFIFYYR